MRKRRFLLVTACILIVSMLAGCGAGNGQDERRTQSNAGTASENESNAATTEDSTGTSDRAKKDSDGIQGKKLVVFFQLPVIQNV